MRKSTLFLLYVSVLLIITFLQQEFVLLPELQNLDIVGEDTRAQMLERYHRMRWISFLLAPFLLLLRLPLVTLCLFIGSFFFAEMNGMEITTLFRDGKTYAIIPSMKRMQEMPTQESINYLNLTDEVVEKNKIKEVGKETILGKECTTYSLEVSQMGQTAKMTVCVWEGYPMKAITDAMGSVITVKVLEFTEGPVDPSLFELPNY